MSSLEEKFDCVVVGSGFGGTIAAIVMANLFLERQKNESVCILERGQWWISHEIPSRSRDTIVGQKNMREYLEDENIPFDYWAHPDNIEGLFRLASMSRQLVRKGLYDLRTPTDFSNKGRNTVSAITASGVGGGSLVYSNVTLRPLESIFRNWPTERAGQGLNNYFEIAENFIGVNRITTISGISNQRLERSIVFQNAARNAKKNNTNILNADNEYDLNLSITDIPDVPTLLSKNGPLHLEKDVTKGVNDDLTPDEAKIVLAKLEKKYKNETNTCQRQGRCNLGCLPGARHTLNKKLFRAIGAKKPLMVKPLCEAYQIEFKENEEYQYTIHYKETEPSIENNGKDKIVRKKIRARILIISGGSVSTTELLLKSRDKGLALSNQLGNKFTTNADLLALARLKKKKIDITRGPINTSHAMFKSEDKEFAFNIEDTAIPSMVAGPLSILFEILFYEAESKRRPLTWQARFSLIRKYPQLFFLLFRGLNLPKIQQIFFRLWREDKFRNALIESFQKFDTTTMEANRFGKSSPLKLYYSIVNHLITNADEPFASASERLKDFFAFSCMGVDKSNGQLSLNTTWESMEEKDDLGEKLQLKWDPIENKDVFDKIMAGVKTIAKEIDQIDDSDIIPVGWDQENPRDSQLVLLHPIGGCPMGFDVSDGVVNNFGEVFKSSNNGGNEVFPNFLVIDGSIIPSSPGVNPSLTIAAISIRCMEHLTQKMGSNTKIEKLLVDA